LQWKVHEFVLESGWEGHALALAIKPKNFFSPFDSSTSLSILFPLEVVAVVTKEFEGFWLENFSEKLRG